MRRKLFGKKAPKRAKRSKKIAALLTFIGLALIIFISLRQLDKRLLPSVLAVAELNAKAQINLAINNAVSKVISEKKLNSSDFYSKQENSEGKITSMSVNTVLVNEVCSQIAVQISHELYSLSNERIEIPMGTMSGIDIFANIGPSYIFSFLPAGNAIVDYQSKMESAGINQINFQVWLDVQSSVRIVNPLQNKEISVARNIPLVNAVLSEEVPDSYWTTPSIK